MNKLSIFYTLEYWKDLLVTHLMDDIHIVKNFASSLYQYTISKEGDADVMRNDLKDIQKMRSLWITYYQDRRKEVPMEIWLMKKDEVEKLHKLIQNIRILIYYGSSIRNAFNVDGKITRFKTHDYHNFMKVLISYYIFTFCIKIN